MTLSSTESIDSLLTWARGALRASTHDISAREATLLLGRVLGVGEARLRAFGERPVTPDDEACFRALITRRATGEPAAYLLGEREHWGRPFSVDARVLVPRPETEHLVEAALRHGPPGEAFVVDVGTGSGCIAVTLACERPAWRLLATDLSLGALRVADRNRRRHRVSDRVHLLATDLLTGVDLEAIDLLVSNPPYVAEDGEVAPDVRAHEPHLALFAENRGRAVIERLLDTATQLRPGASVVIEIGHDQASWLRRAITERPVLELVELIRDYGGIERTVVIRRRSDAATDSP